jgi:hypothetical protein
MKISTYRLGSPPFLAPTRPVEGEGTNLRWSRSGGSGDDVSEAAAVGFDKKICNILDLLVQYTCFHLFNLSLLTIAVYAINVLPSC